MKYQPRIMRDKDAAKEIGIPVQEFLEWAAAVDLKPVRILHHVRWRWDDIDAKLRGDVEAPEDRW